MSRLPTGCRCLCRRGKVNLVEIGHCNRLEIEAFKSPGQPGREGDTMSDYINRDAAKQILSRLLVKDAAECACNLVDCVLPTDVEPVRYGKWNIRLADEMTLCLECSVCGRRVDNIDLHYLLEAGEYGEACRRYPYCHCGAKMNLEDSHDTTKQ